MATFKSEYQPKFMVCPYEKHHLILSHKFQRHLVKCEKNHKLEINKFFTCPFDASHKLTQAVYYDHIIGCFDVHWIIPGNLPGKS